MRSEIRLPQHQAALLMALAGAALLVGVLVLQYGFGAEPCRLCIWQRYPHLVLVALGLLGYWFRPAPALAAGALVALGGAALGAYHFGIEQGYWALPEGCAAGASAASIEELKQLLAGAPPACDQVGFTLLGLSLSAWNVVVSLLIGAFALIALGRSREAADARLKQRAAR
jgi:disulfide bond formation protein DsbB